MSDPSRRIGPRDVAPDELDEPFWGACGREEFLLHWCTLCNRAYWPASTCIDHGLATMEWRPASGRGAVFTYTVVHHAYSREFADRLPYAAVVVQLEEGPFFHTNIIGCQPSDIYVGMPVEVAFEHIDADTTLPTFRPAPAPAPSPPPSSSPVTPKEGSTRLEEQS